MSFSNTFSALLMRKFTRASSMKAKLAAKVRFGETPKVRAGLAVRLRRGTQRSCVIFTQVNLGRKTFARNAQTNARNVRATQLN